MAAQGTRQVAKTAAATKGGRQPHPRAIFPGVGKLFLLFTLVPLVDLWVLVQIGRAVGFWTAVALVIATGFAGAWLAKAEGFRVLREWQGALAGGRLPEEGVLSGVLVLAGGLLLVTPGVLTDAAGLALLFPPTRRLAAAGARRWLRRRIAEGRVHVVTYGGEGRFGPADREIDVTPPRPRDRLGEE